MKDISLVEAIREIGEADRTSNGTWPFFFLVGAGISAKNGKGPGIPLTSEIVEQLEQRAREKNVPLAPANETMADRYMYYLANVLVDPTMRWKFFANLIQPKGKRQQIPLANTLLAQILLDEQTPFVVTTTNFDDFLSRALVLFGGQPLIFDHAKAAGRVDVERREVQVVHLHGSYHHYEMKNTTEEITRPTTSSDVDGPSMRTALDRLLARHTPLVIGYSGWEKDVVMRTLKSRLSDGLAHNMYWFCYRRSDKDHLPNWLREHEHVKFVIPAEPQETQLVSPHRASTSREVKPLEPEGLREGEGPPALRAMQVFRTMIGKCRIKQATLLRDPLGHFAGRLREALSVAEDKRLREVIRRVERAQALYRAETRRDAVARLNELRGELIAAAVEVNARGLVRKSRELLSEKNLSPADLTLIATAAFDLGHDIDDNTDDELACYQVAADVAQVWQRRNLPRQGAALLCGLKAHIYAGTTCMKRGQFARAVRWFDAAVKLFSHYRGDEFRQRVARATLWRGVTYIYANDTKRALKALAQTIRDYANDPRPAVTEIVAVARYNRGVAYARGGDRKRAHDEYRAVIRDFAAHRGPMAAITVANAWINGAMIRAESGFLDDAVSDLKKFIRTASPNKRKTAAAVSNVLRALADRARELLAVYESRLNEAAE